ncbi:MAG: hypothetical protein OXL40_04200 [Bacteroidota bacterium]|nr:hypothetical protein [Bacteroidota bacterium]
MNSRLLLTAAAIILLFTGCIPADQGASEEMGQTGPDDCPNLVGSWELVEIRESAGALSGEFESDPDYQEAPTLKVVNSTHWMFIRQTAGSFVHAQGGRYTLDSLGQYTDVCGVQRDSSECRPGI